MTRGKLIDTWHYQYEGVEVQDAGGRADGASTAEADEAIERDLRARASQIKVPIKLFIHKKYADSDRPPQAVKEVWFSVTCEKPVVRIEGPDIEALRAAMWEKLDEHFKVKWERYYKVQISPGWGTGAGAGLQFEYTDVDKGTAWDGTLLLREHEFTNGRVIRPWPGEFRDGQGRILACIPNTKENTRALAEFADRIRELRRVLSGFLRPEVILQTLSDLSAIALLPKPAQDPDDSD